MIMANMGDNGRYTANKRKPDNPQSQRLPTGARYAPDGSGTETTSEPAPPSKTIHVVVLKFSSAYLRSTPGILKVLQAVFVMVSLIFLTTAGSVYAGYLLLPLDWHLRVFVFSTVFSLLYSVASFFVHVYRLIDSLRFPWKKFNFTVDCLLCFLLLFSSSLVASTIGYYDLSKERLSGSTKRHLVLATIFGYISMSFYGVSAYYAGKQLRGFFGQFTPQRFASSQGSMSQPPTPSTETVGISIENVVV